MEGIYRIRNKTSGKYYIGSSHDVEGRWDTHKRHLGRGDHSNPFLQNAWDKYGKGAFVFETVEEVLGGKATRLAKEQSCLDMGFEQEILYNIARRANCPPSQSPTEEARAKISKALTGRKHSRETRTKMGKSQKGREFPERHRANLSKAQRGRQFSKGHKINLSKALTGRRLSGQHRANISKAKVQPYPAFYNVKTGEYIPAGHNLAKMCRGRSLAYYSFSGLKLGVIKQTRGGWQVGCKRKKTDF